MGDRRTLYLDPEMGLCGDSQVRWEWHGRGLMAAVVVTVVPVGKEDSRSEPQASWLQEEVEEEKKVSEE